MMFQVGDQVVYGIHGICQILDLEERTVDRKKIKYFALEPMDQPGARFFVPSETLRIFPERCCLQEYFK